MCSLTPIALLPALLFGGCSGATNSTQDVAGSADPLGVYAALGTEGRTIVVSEALVAVQSDCMVAKGFEPPTAITAQPVSTLRALREQAFAFGVQSGSDVEDFGLGASEAGYAAEVEQAEAAARTLRDALDARGPAYAEQWLDAYGGVEEPVAFPVEGVGSVSISPDGCQAEAYIAVFGDLGAGVSNEFLGGRLRERIVDRVLAGEEVGVALEQWRSCMDRGGFDVGTPQDVYRQIEGAFTPGDDEVPGSVTAVEQERSAVDRLKACDGESDLYSLGWQAVGPATSAVLDEFAVDVENYQAAVERSLEVLERR